MLKDITLGQYFPGNSVIHKLDPRMKLVLTILYIVMVFTAKSPAGYAIAFGLLAFVVLASHISPKLILIFVFIACTLFITFTLLSRRVMRKELVQGMNKKRQKVKTAENEATIQEVDQG